MITVDNAGDGDGDGDGDTGGDGDGDGDGAAMGTATLVATGMAMHQAAAATATAIQAATVTAMAMGTATAISAAVMAMVMAISATRAAVMATAIPAAVMATVTATAMADRRATPFDPTLDDRSSGPRAPDWCLGPGDSPSTDRLRKLARRDGSCQADGRLPRPSIRALDPEHIPWGLGNRPRRSPIGTVPGDWCPDDRPASRRAARLLRRPRSARGEVEGPSVDADFARAGPPRTDRGSPVAASADSAGQDALDDAGGHRSLPNSTSPASQAPDGEAASSRSTPRRRPARWVPASSNPRQWMLSSTPPACGRGDRLRPTKLPRRSRNPTSASRSRPTRSRVVFLRRKRLGRPCRSAVSDAGRCRLSDGIVVLRRLHPAACGRPLRDVEHIAVVLEGQLR